jgi:hypothetical protein
LNTGIYLESLSGKKTWIKKWRRENPSISTFAEKQFSPRGDGRFPTSSAVEIGPRHYERNVLSSPQNCKHSIPSIHKILKSPSIIKTQLHQHQSVLLNALLVFRETLINTQTLRQCYFSMAWHRTVNFVRESKTLTKQTICFMRVQIQVQIRLTNCNKSQKCKNWDKYRTLHSDELLHSNCPHQLS